MSRRMHRRQVARLLAACFLASAVSVPVTACVPLSPFSGLTSTPEPEPVAEAEPPTPEDPLGEAPPLDTPEPTNTPEPELTETRVPPIGVTASPFPSPAATAVPSPTPTAEPIPIGPIHANSDGQFALLLLGYGGPGHDGPYLTDSMMAVIANPTKKTVTMLSLPRDSWVPLIYTGGKPNAYDKLNTAYAYAHDTRLFTNRIERYKGTNGAGNMAKDTVSRILGIPIDYYLAIDFQGFKSVVDTLGGIDVDVPNSFSSRYPANDNPKVNAAWMVVRFKKGRQHMNGTSALQFARAREVLDNPDEVGDFARATRQRLVLTAIKDRVLSPAGLLHLPQLLAIASRTSVTDYPLPAITGLLGMITSWSQVRIFQAALSTVNYLVTGTGPNGTYILVPRTEDLSWSSVRAFARRLWQDPALGMALSQTEVKIVNRSGNGKLGSQVSARLEDLGYSVSSAETGAVQARTVVRDQSGGTADRLVAELGLDLGLPALSATADATSDPKRIVLELGKDALGVARTDLPPVESDAPTSKVGVVRVGSWAQ